MAKMKVFPLFNPFVTLAVFGGLKLRYVSDYSLVSGMTSLDGSPAVVSCPLGRGRAIYVGTDPYTASVAEDGDSASGRSASPQGWSKLWPTLNP